MSIFTSLSIQRPRVAVSAFYAAWRVGTGWREIRSAAPKPGSDTPPLTLRALCEHVAGRLPASALPAKSYRSQPDVLRSRLRDELASAGLWDRSTRRLTIEAEQVSLSFSSSKGFWPQRLEEKYFDVVDWLCCDGAARTLGRAIGAAGRLASPVAACATGAHAIALGAQWIEDGYADVVIAGAVERPIEPLVRAGYEQLGALSKSGRMRPFDRRRDGFVPNDGMGFVVLENATTAVGRGAPVHAYLSGRDMGADASSLLEMQSDGSTIARAIERSLRASRTDIGYINAHGTATRINDVIETRAIQSTLGRAVPVSSTKPLTGHLLGAAGAVEAALCLQVLREGFVPPTLHLEEPDEECDLDCVPNIGRDLEVQAVLSLSYGFGGHIGALLFEKE